jgi:lipoyl(octanoyl) transferase
MRFIRTLHPLDYSRYLSLQNRLRQHRRELLLFCEHPPTITAGVTTNPENLLTDRDALHDLGIDYFDVKRGGDLTAHEPGQCVIYPHVDIQRRKIPVSHFFKSLAEITRDALQIVWGIDTLYSDESPGLYLKSGEKIASLGIVFKSFFTSHGLAVNICNTKRTFDHIHPCGRRNLVIVTVRDLGGDPELLPEFIDLWRERFSGFMVARQPSD